MGEDQIPPQMVKIAVDFCVEPLTDIISSCYNTRTFPELAKKAPVTPIGKQR